MPTIEVSHNDLCSLTGKHIPIGKLKEEAVLFAKGEVDAADGDALKIDIKDTNRPDLWSAEGVAREIAGRYGKPGLPEYRASKSKVVVNVDPKLKGIRPHTVCAVVRGLNITPEVLSQMIQLQEKVSLTFGRNRKEVAIGVYDLNKIEPPIKFTSVKPDGIKFVPLEFDKELTPKQILEQHPKGKEFRHLLEGMKEYPIFIDAAGQVLSMPPIINSDWTGKVTEATRDLFIECSGFDLKFLMPALNVIVSALADRGGKIETVQVSMPGKTIHTPDLSPKKAVLDLDYSNRRFGMKLTAEQTKKLLEQARYNVSVKGKKLEVSYPCYRQDIMHQADIAEDAIISYGYNKIEPELPKISVVGSEMEIERFSDSVAELMVGMGLQEVLSYTLSNRNDLLGKMGLPDEHLIEVENPVSSNWSVFRNGILPNLMDMLSKNRHNDYPQNIFETGKAVHPDPKAETRARDARKLAMALCGSKATFEDAASLVEALLNSMGLEYKPARGDRPFFIPGRSVIVLASGRPVGIMGEIHPQVLENWGIAAPTAAAELDLDAIFSILKKSNR